MVQKPKLKVVRSDPRQDKSEAESSTTATRPPESGGEKPKRRVVVRRSSKTPEKKAPPTSQYFLVLASLGTLPRCETCSSIEEVDEKIRKAASSSLPEDFRPFVFVGSQAAVVDHYGVARVIDPASGEMLGGGASPTSDKGSLETGQVFKEDDEFGGDDLLGSSFDDENDNLFSLD